MMTSTRAPTAPQVTNPTAKVTGPAAPGESLIDVVGRTASALSPAAMQQGHRPSPAAAVWLTSLHPGASPDPSVRHAYTLLQKNKTFSPHLLIVPVGSTVHFPNADPFFHNVFSLFDGRRFDLGLYEAGSTRDVVFSREGVSYIFCNIHPEMSAVVIVLNTTYYDTIDAHGRFRFKSVPADSYLLHVWIEGESQETLNKLTRKVQISEEHSDLGTLTLPSSPRSPAPHENKFGQDYDTHEAPAY